MEQRFEGIFAEISRRGRMIEAVLAGETSDIPPEEILEEDAFSGLVMDENKDASLEAEHMRLMMEKLLGSGLDTAKRAAQFRDREKMTFFNIYAKPLGVDGDYFLSCWHNFGEKDYYVLWPKAMYDAQLIGDEETEAPFSLREGEWE